MTTLIVSGLCSSQYAINSQWVFNPVEISIDSVLYLLSKGLKCLLKHCINTDEYWLRYSSLRVHAVWHGKNEFWYQAGLIISLGLSHRPHSLHIY